MTEQDARKKVQEIYGKDHWYILLSSSKANMMNGKSVPYIGQLENGEKILFVFTDYELAKKYVDDCKYEVLGGNYPLAYVEKENNYNSLYAILNNALAMGISNVDIDPCSPNAFGCNIRWFLEANGLKPQDISVLISENEAANLMQNNGQIPLRMNSLDIYNFHNPYIISNERANEILHHIFGTEEELTFSFFVNLFLQKETLHENCFVMDYLNSRMIPMAKQEQKEGDIQWFTQVSKVIQSAIWKRLSEYKLYVLTDPANGDLFIKNGGIYVLYTDMFKYMGQYAYRLVNGKDELLKLASGPEIQRFFVTDGPHGLAVLEKNLIDKDYCIGN